MLCAYSKYSDYSALPNRAIICNILNSLKQVDNICKKGLFLSDYADALADLNLSHMCICKAVFQTTPIISKMEETYQQSQNVFSQKKYRQTSMVHNPSYHSSRQKCNNFCQVRLKEKLYSFIFIQKL